MAETAIFFIPEVFARSKFDALDQIFTKDAHPAPPRRSYDQRSSCDQ